MNVDRTLGLGTERVRWACGTAGRRSKARSTTARFSAPERASNSARADRIAARLRVTRATGASAGRGSGISPTALRVSGPLSAFLEIRAGKDRCGVPVGADAEPDKIRRPFEIGQPRIGRLAGRAVVGRSFDHDRQDVGASWQEVTGNHRDVAQAGR